MITCHVTTVWYDNKSRWTGYIVDDDGNVILSQIKRDTRAAALLDAERMKEELEQGQR